MGRYQSLLLPDGPITVALFTPLGRRLSSIALPLAEGLSWCGDSRHLVAESREGSDWVIVELDARTQQVMRVASPSVASVALACSPDASAAAYRTVIDGNAAMVVQNLASGKIEQLPTGGSRPYDVRWVPDRVPPVLAELRIADAPGRLRWGEHTLLHASGHGATAISSGRWRSRRC